MARQFWDETNENDPPVIRPPCKHELKPLLEGSNLLLCQKCGEIIN